MNEAQLHDVPSVGSDERMHVLDSSCWCNPTVEVVPPKVSHNA